MYKICRICKICKKKNENVNDMTYTQTFAKFANHTYQIKLTNPYLPNEID